MRRGKANVLCVIQYGRVLVDGALGTVHVGTVPGGESGRITEADLWRSEFGRATLTRDREGGGVPRSLTSPRRTGLPGEAR